MLGGFVDFLGPSMLMRSKGGITGLANVAPVNGNWAVWLSPASVLACPSAGYLADSRLLWSYLQKSCRKLYDLTLSALTTGNAKELQQAIALQEIVSAGDWTLQKGGISGTKCALQQAFGYGGRPRHPILAYEEEEGKSVERLMDDMKALLKYEESL